MNGENNWRILLDHIVQIVDQLNIGRDQIRVGVVSYGGETRTEIYLDDFLNKQDLKDRISRLSYLRGNANTYRGIETMHNTLFQSNAGDRADAPNIAVVFFAGRSSDSDRTIQEADSARSDNIRIYSVGITNFVDEREVRLVSSSPQEIDRSYFLPREFNDLRSYVTPLVAATCVKSNG